MRTQTTKERSSATLFVIHLIISIILKFSTHWDSPKGLIHLSYSSLHFSSYRSWLIKSIFRICTFYWYWTPCDTYDLSWASGTELISPWSKMQWYSQRSIFLYLILDFFMITVSVRFSTQETRATILLSKILSLFCLLTLIKSFWHVWCIV